jgi:dihydroorotase-like cyclic amidohydrolase
MRRAREYASGLGLTVHVVPLDRDLGAGGCAHEGPVATRLGLPPIPVAAEVAAIRAWLSLVEDTGARMHFGRLSSARAVDLLASAKQRGLPVTADVAMLALALEFAHEAELPPLSLARRLALAPARILGLPGGGLQPGAAADFTLIDPGLDWIADDSRWRSAGRNSPFLGASLRGCSRATWVDGRRVDRPA